MTVQAPVQRSGPSPKPASPRARQGQEEQWTDICQPTPMKNGGGGGNYSSGGGDEARNRAMAREREKEQELSVRVNPNMTGIYTEPVSSFHSWVGNGPSLGHG
jgi:hypothetical protein